MLLSANIFQPLIDVFEAVLKFFHNTVGVPWGWSIVLLTVVIRLILVPLTLKQFHSMQALQRLQPELKAVQAKYKDDKNRQQQELMKFYKENNVNPLGSCLPMAAQLPVFISLFYMLRQSLRADVCSAVQPHHLVKGISLIDKAVTEPCGPHNGAGFLFIGDLTNRATGITLIVLIVLYVGTQLASTLLMSTPTMDRTQRQIMLVMPLMFVFFVINFPAGVIVYWITTNSWTMAQQYAFRRRIGMVGAPARAAAAAAATAGAGGGSGAGGSGAGGSVTGSGAGGSRAGGSGRSAGGGAGRTVPAAGGNGSGGGGLGGLGNGLGNLLRGRPKAEEEAAAVTTSRPARATAPPRPPRKKKKRSGRRR